MKILLILDNLDIGGIQRLALDESYWLIDREIETQILCLTPEPKAGSMLQIDFSFPLSKKLKFVFVKKDIGSQLRATFVTIKNFKPDLILCHSARGILLSRLARFSTSSRAKIVGFVHQLATLSSTKQNLKRLGYFLMADRLHFLTLQFQNEFENFLSRRVPFLELRRFRQKFIFDRVGLYIPRFDFLQTQAECITYETPGLIYYGRAKEWKGYNVFLNLIQRRKNDFSFVFIVPDGADIKRLVIKSESDKNVFVWESRSIWELKFQTNVIHIYATSFPDNTRHPMSISFNVLECLFSGIPSVMSHENFETWPELRDSPLIFCCTWEPGNIDEMLRKALRVSYEDRIKEANRVKQLLSIDAHMNRIISSIDM